MKGGRITEVERKKADSGRDRGQQYRPEVDPDALGHCLLLAQALANLLQPVGEDMYAVGHGQGQDNRGRGHRRWRQANSRPSSDPHGCNNRQDNYD